MGESKTCGILLRKILLGNDDALMEFFTPKEGKITLKIKSFGRSKKRQSEIDFFRLLDLNIFHGRTSNTLRSVTTTKLFHEFGTNLELNMRGFEWLERLRRVIPEEKPTPRFFEYTKLFFDFVSPENCKNADMYFRLKILQWLGVLPDLKSYVSSSTDKIFSFLCQSDIRSVFEKILEIPDRNIQELKEIIEIGEKHI
jgi:DNA repair protein RecO